MDRLAVGVRRAACGIFEKGAHCHAGALNADSYQFTPSEHGQTHLFEGTETADLRTITMEELTQAKTLIEHLDISNFYVKSERGATGIIGLHVGELDRFLDGAQVSPYNVTVAEDVKAYIEEEA